MSIPILSFKQPLEGPLEHKKMDVPFIKRFLWVRKNPLL
jgi:hypothetical protein